MIAWMLVMGVRASLLTHTLQHASATWEEIQQHVEVIPFYLSSEEVSYDRVPPREERLSVPFGSLSLCYHHISPKSLPQADYTQAKNSLRSIPQIEVLQRFRESLQWQQSVYFVFLIYDDTVQAVDTPGAIKPENFTFDVDLKEFELKDDILVVRLAYTQVSSEWQFLQSNIATAKRYLELRKYPKAAKFIAAIENSSSFLRLLSTPAELPPWHHSLGISLFLLTISSIYFLLLYSYIRHTKSNSKGQV